MPLFGDTGEIFPPPGFCSLPCHDEHRKEAEAAPPEPSIIVLRMRQHNLLMHGCDSVLLEWNCARCQELEALYSNSLSYHGKRLTREMIEGKTAAA